MEAVRKLTNIRPVAPINLDMILNNSVNLKTKLQLISRVHDNLDQFAQNQVYFENMIIIVLKMLSNTDPVFTPDHDVFKLRKCLLQIIYKICSSSEKIKNHVQNIMDACLKVIETDNEQCVMYCVLILKELLTSFKPTFDGCFKIQIIQFLKLIFDIFNNSSTTEKIFNFQKTSDLKVLINTIRLTTTITKNNINYVFIPMGKLSSKILKELALILKMYYGMYHGIQSFMKEIIENFPILMNFFCLDIPFKPDYRDMVIDFKFAQIRLLGFFSLMIKDHKDDIFQHCSSFASKVISLLNCNISADVSGLRIELLSGFESLILIDYKYEFVPFMDSFLDETLITGRSWSLKNELRTRAYIYIDHLITYLHNRLSLNFLVRVVHFHFSNMLDPTLQPDVQINLINMVMISLTHIIQKQNHLITNLNTIEKNKNPLIDILFRVIQIFVIKLKQFQKFYFPKLKNISQENMKESISSIVAENEKPTKFVYGYHFSQIPLYTVADSQRFVTIIISAFRQIFQIIVKIEGRQFSIEYYNKKSFKMFIKHSLSSLKVFSCPIKKKLMIKEILSAISCIDPIYLKLLLLENTIVKLIYTNQLEALVLDLALNNDVLFQTFSCVIFEYILNNLLVEIEKQCIFDLVKRLQSNFKYNKNEKVTYEYLYKIIKMLLNIIQNTKYPVSYLEILKTILNIVESIKYDYDENMNTVLKCLFNDLFVYHQSLPESSIVLKTTLAELCLAECVFKVVFQSQTINILSVIVYSLYIPELTPQGFGILEKCLNILPNFFDNESVVHVRNDISKGLCHCLSSPIESISQPAINLLGKFGGFNRSAIVKPYYLNAQKQFNNVSDKPKLYVSFEEYNDQSIEIYIAPGLDAAIETLMTKSDRFLRAHSWDVIKGFFTLSMDYDNNNIIKLLSNINWETFRKISKLELNYSKTFIDETFIKALIGLLICCNDEYMKMDAINYFNMFTKRFMHVSICYFYDISCGRSLEVHPFTICDAISFILSNENESVSDFGELAIEIVIDELCSILGYNMINYPLITYMLKQFCEYCYDPNWIRKLGGCSGIHILFSKIFKKQSDAKEYSNWFIKHFVDAFRATLFIFSDLRGNLTFGTLDIARKNLDAMLHWFYLIKPSNSFQHYFQKTILKELTKNIINPNDILREQSIKLICIIAEKQNQTVSQILTPFYKYIISVLPGNRLFNTYTFKSQMGIMKGHIFCAFHSIPAENLDLSKTTHKYYFDILCTICSDSIKRVSKNNMIKCLTFDELVEYRQTALQVLVNCLHFLKQQDKIKVFRILLNELKSSNLKVQEAAYQCLKSCNSKMLLQLNMVDKLIFYYTDLFEDHDKITLVNIRFILFLSKLFPLCPNSKLCTVLLNAFKYIWSYLKQCENRTSNDQLKIAENILKVICFVKNSQFSHIQEICEIILNDAIIDIELSNRLHPLLTNCLLKYPENSVVIFFQERHIKNSIWCSFFNSMLRNELCKPLRNVLISNSLRLETLLMSSKNDPTNTIQYESIKIVYNLVHMEKKWKCSKKLISLLLNIWTNPQYKERFKNLANIKSTEWNEPKMLIKIVLAYYKQNFDEVFILFQILPMFSNRYPFDINFFRLYLENSVIKPCTVKWTRLAFFKFIDLYHKKSVNCDILGRILQFIVLPCFSLCIENGQREQLLCSLTKSEDNIISVIINKVFPNIRMVLSGSDHDGLKVFLCQLICILIDDLLNFNDTVCDLIYNSVISCTWIRCTMDLNVKYHCYLILTFIMLSKNAAKREKLNNGIYYELIKASFVEALPVINYSLDLIVSTVYDKSSTDIHTFAVCMKKIMLSDPQNVPILSHICSFVMKYNTLFYPCKPYLLRNLLGSLFPIAKNNNVPDYKKIAIDLSCMIIKWELTENDGNLKLKLQQKRTTDDIQSTVSQKKKSSEAIDSCLNFLAMVGCQTFDDKPESRISKLASRSATLFKTILSTEPIDTIEVKLKFGWVEKLLDTFIKKEKLVKQNPNAHGNTNASVMNVLTTFDLISFMLNVLSPKLMLEAIKPLQDLLIQFLQLSLNEESNNIHSNQKDNFIQNRLTVSQIRQYNEGTIKVISEILKTFSTNDGLEKLHIYIQMIISDGLNSNCPIKIDASLSLLKVSLIHFSNYMNSDILNTIGDILFKFNENNKNPLIKIKCLEILKTHVDTLQRGGKQLFIEKVVMECLDKARDIENNIPFEVQVKCFEIIITYIKDLPEATEGIFLNKIILEYIKTTTDERIMRTILNVIKKWIDICRDESVFFNCQVIKILKCITILNHFPKFTETCYELNLEIFKNWNFSECIEYGLDCKSPSIRNNFFDLYEKFWCKNGLCMRLYTIVSDHLNYDLEYSIALYVQLLFVKISKNMNPQGNFRLIDNKKLPDFNESISISEECNSSELCPLARISMFNWCSALVQLSFVDFNLAKHLWLSVFPGIWKLFNDDQRTLLSSKAVKFLANSKLKNSFMTTFYEAIILCKPKIVFEPYQMVYIGKTYNLWYLIINEMEDICEYYEHNKKNEAVEGIIQMYSMLQEEDMLESIFENIIECKDTKKAFSLEQLGCIEIASQKYIELLFSEKQVAIMNTTTSHIKNDEFKRIRLTKCLRELNEWNLLHEIRLDGTNILLNIEHRWKISIENSTCSYNDLKWYLEHKQKIWPSSLIWKYHFYLGMFGLNELDQQVTSTVQEHVEIAIEDIVNKWKVLPKHLCKAHIPLLQATQLIVEIREANNIQNSFLNSPQNINNTEILIGIWNNRKPWIGDNLSVWNDLISWRQTYYSFLKQRHNLSMRFIKNAQDQSKLMFGDIALKQNILNVCIKTLNKIDLKNVDTSNLLYRMYLEGKYVQKLKKYNEDYSVIAKSLANNVLMEDMKPLFLAVKGSFYYYRGDEHNAFKYLSNAFQNETNEKFDSIEWQNVIEYNYNSLLESIKKNIGINKTPSDEYVTIINNNKILANSWVHWGTLIQLFFCQMSIKDIQIALLAMKCYIIASKLITKKKCNAVVARILWLLIYDDNNNILLRTLEKCRIMFSEIWLPQVLNICIENNKPAIGKIVSEIGSLYPQQMYLILKRMYLTEKLNKTDTVSVNYKRNNTEKIDMKINKIKQIMLLLKKKNFGFFQLDYFVDQIKNLKESWDEELRRNLYDCLCRSNDYAFKNKTLDIQVPSEILNLIETIITWLKTRNANTVKFEKTYYYEYTKIQFPLDFSFTSVPSIKFIVKLLKNWIKYLENISTYPSKFIHQFRCSTIHNFDWSGIRLPCDHYIEDFFNIVMIHNFGGYVYLKDKCGTVVKQITIRGTDGLLYAYNISWSQYIESEERIYQLFHIINDYLLDFKETAKRFLKISVPKTFTISPQIRMVETNKSLISLLEIYKENTTTDWINEDIEFWFSTLKYCVMLERPNPLQTSLLIVQKQYCSDELLKNWVLMKYPSPSDYWTFRKTFIEHYSVLCFLEYAFNLIKLKPEMLCIDKNSGVAAVLNYTFFLNEVNGKLAQNQNTPFRMTPNITKFITPYRKYQMINCLTATGQCLFHSIDDISAKLKLLLKDEYIAAFNVKNNQGLMDNNQKTIDAVEHNFNHILNNFKDFEHFSIQNQIPNLLSKAILSDVLCFENPNWRPWL